MQLGMIGLGRMGGNIVRRLMKHGHTTVVYDKSEKAVADLAADGAAGAKALEDFVKKLEKPRTAWVMLPAGKITEETIEALAKLMEQGDVIIDGGNTFWQDDVRRGKALKAARHPLSRRRHLRRHLGHRARLLHDDRRRQGRGRPARSDLQGAGAGRRRHPAHGASRGPRSPQSSKAISMPARSAPGTSSRWSTTASNTA